MILLVIGTVNCMFFSDYTPRTGPKIAATFLNRVNGEAWAHSFVFYNLVYTPVIQLSP